MKPDLLLLERIRPHLDNTTHTQSLLRLVLIEILHLGYVVTSADKYSICSV